MIESEPERLVFALEPEAASIYCKQLPSEGYIAEEACQETLEQKPGTQYMVVDCGGTSLACPRGFLLHFCFILYRHKILLA